MSRKQPPERRSHLFTSLRNNFIAGVIVIAPIGLTVWLVWSVVGWVDSWVLPFVPPTFNPDKYIGINLRGMGVIIFLLFTVVVGWVAKGYVGRGFIRWGENVVGRMPVIRSIYTGAKQIAETVFSESSNSFDKACLIEYPGPRSWAIAFVSTTARGEINQKIPLAEEVVTVFMPTTPNPTSGFLMYVPRSAIIELDMSIEDAAKLIISAGLVYPVEKPVSAPALSVA